MSEKKNCWFDDQTKECIVSHLRSLQIKIESYFPDIHNGHIVVKKIHFPKELQWQLCQMILRINTMPWKMSVRYVISAWKLYCQSSRLIYQKLMKKLSKFTLRVLVPFVTTYLCQSWSSTLVFITTKKRIKLDVEMIWSGLF